MTQQYLASELSLLLGQLQRATTNDASTVQVAHLCHQAETGPRTELAVVAVHALELGDCICLDSLTCGDAAAFTARSRSAPTCGNSAFAPACSTNGDAETPTRRGQPLAVADGQNARSPSAAEPCSADHSRARLPRRAFYAVLRHRLKLVRRDVAPFHPTNRRFGLFDELGEGSRAGGRRPGRAGRRRGCGSSSRVAR
jgi:hypothetical protein